MTQATSEHSGPITSIFKDMIGRGFNFEEGILVVVDGGTGMLKAIENAPG